MADRFFIAPYDSESGFQTNYRPWLIPDTAFAHLENAYVFRGRVRKRFGSTYMGVTLDPLISRLRLQVGVITSGSFSGNVRTLTVCSTMPTSIGQAFSITDGTNTTIFTVVNTAAGVQQMLRTDNSGSTATYNLTNSAFNITGTGFANGTPVYFYPNLPVMGLLTFENTPISDERCIGFDTRFAYEWNNGWSRLSTETTPGDASWTGDNSQFFWASTWVGADPSERAFYVTNFNETEPNFLRYMIGSTWFSFRPALYVIAGPTTIYLDSARIIVPFKNCLLAFNTWEGPSGGPSVNYPNRVRYSKSNDSPFATDAWRKDIPGNGGALDASTFEAIVTVEYIKDRLIVYFERSTWELVFTGNKELPFTWQKINTELGSESTFSVIPFDKVVLGIGNVGIHACNGANVERIDNRIPQTVFTLKNLSEGPERIYGIRDYEAEMVYWTFPDQDASNDFPYPTRVLVYNYKTATWAINDDSITAFGYFQPPSSVGWNSETITWDSDITWDNSSSAAKNRKVIAGNQEGYTFLIDFQVPTNAGVLQITNVTNVGNIQLTISNHNLRETDFIFIQLAQWSDSSDSMNFKIYEVIELIDENNIIVTGDPFTGTYIGGGVVARVSRINIITKEYNFYADKGRNAYISKVDFMVDTTASGQLTVDFYVSTSQVPLLDESQINGVLVGTGNLDTFPYIIGNPVVKAPLQYELTSTRVWHPVYFQADGEVVQLQLTMNDEQMRDVEIMECDFQLHAMCFHAMPTSSRLQ